MDRATRQWWRLLTVTSLALNVVLVVWPPGPPCVACHLDRGWREGDPTPLEVVQQRVRVNQIAVELQDARDRVNAIESEDDLHCPPRTIVEVQQDHERRLRRLEEGRR
jgi:hypothetical protein